MFESLRGPIPQRSASHSGGPPTAGGGSGQVDIQSVVALLTDTCTGDPIVSGCCATGASRLGNASVRGSGVRHSLFGNLVAWDGGVPLLAVLRNKGPAARGTQVDEPPAYGGWLGLNGS